MEAKKERERFIPVAKSQLIADLANSDIVGKDKKKDFSRFSKILGSLFHFEFHARIEALQESYRPFDPDSDLVSVRTVDENEKEDREKQFMAVLAKVLDQANYQQITETDLAYAMNRESLFDINLFVDFGDFDNQLIFGRGARDRKIECKTGWFKKTTKKITVYERVALIIKFKDNTYFEDHKREDLTFQPGSMLVKLFKEIPKGDLEMLFPNAQVRMKLKDKLLMGGLAVGGGVTVFLKAGAGLVAMAGILWLMAHAMVSQGGRVPSLGPAQVSGLVGGVTALAAIGAFLFKQWNGYKTRKIKFMKTLGDSLYFKNLDNNAGVFYHVIAEAEEEEFKEALLSYLFLLQSESGLTASALDAAIEAWFSKIYGVSIDFEIEDALAKLERLELCSKEASVYKAIALPEACRWLAQKWDDVYAGDGSIQTPMA